jgi:hypothetical protein
MPEDLRFVLSSTLSSGGRDPPVCETIPYVRLRDTGIVASDPVRDRRDRYISRASLPREPYCVPLGQPALSS